MGNNQNSMTAPVSAFGRAYHNENDSPVILRDDIARRLMTDDEYKQIAGYMAGGLSFLAPGKAKELSGPAEALRYVLADFTRDTLATAFMNVGFDTTARSFFSLLGVSYYLTKEHLQALMTAIADLVPQGSSIVFDWKAMVHTPELAPEAYNTWHSCKPIIRIGVWTKEPACAGESIINFLSNEDTQELAPGYLHYADENLFSSDVKRVQNMVAMAEASGEPMKSCFHYVELEKLLEESGWLIYEYLSPTEIEAHYFMGRDDYLHAFEHINYVLAKTSKQKNQNHDNTRS